MYQQAIAYRLWAILVIAIAAGCAYAATTVSNNDPGDDQSCVIKYRLNQPGRVSLAIYDKDGIQVRTLRNAEPQTAGTHAIVWDGFDQNGQPVPPGKYTWKLLQGQGLKAEYLFSLGTSTRELPWIGNHGGPNSLAVEGNEVLITAGASEGAAQLLGMDQTGNVHIATNPGGDIDDLARAGNLGYIVSTQLGRLGIINAETGEKTWWSNTNGAPTIATVKEIMNPVASTIKGSQSIFRYDVPNTTGGWNWYAGRVTLHNSKDQPIKLKLFVSISYGAPNPLRDLTLQPLETVTVDLGNVVVYWDTNEQFVCAVDGDPGWEMQRLEILSSADRVAAARPDQVPAGQQPAPHDPDQYNNPAWGVSDNQVWLGNRRAEMIQQIQPKRDGKILREVRVPGFQDLAFTRDGQLLVISGHTVCVVHGQELEPVIRDLDDPRRLAVDSTTGDIFIVDWGTHQQVRHYDVAYHLVKVFGREGGRRYGLYKAEDFYHVDDVAGDGHGGFYVVENWGARRTAHFDVQGKCLREWYGGQGFYQYVTQDPRHPDRFWFPGTFNTDVFECEVDWKKRDWRVRAVYDIHDEVAKTLGGLLYAPGGYVGGAMHVLYHDLNGDKKPERLLWVEGQSGMLLRIDEAAGRLVPLAANGYTQGTVLRVLQSAQPTESEAQQYAPMLAAYNTTYRKTMPWPQYWSWADADGDGLMQAAELRFFTGNYLNATYVGGFFTGFQMADDLTLWQRSGWYMKPGGPSWYVMKPDGYTKCGAPIWRYDTRTRSNAPDAILHAIVNPDGSSFEARITDGEGYISNGVAQTGGHGGGWPSTLAGGTLVVNRLPDGRVRWQSGYHSPTGTNDPGQLHSPVRIAGIVKGCVGVADHVFNPLAVWTTDGLYVGDLFDRKANGGQPGVAYAWGEYKGPLSGKERGYYFDRNALTAYDMNGNSLLSLTPNGDVFYTTTGVNNAPIYRVTGFDELKRQQGKIIVEKPAEKPVETGTGLSALYYAQPDFNGEATPRLDSQIWFGGKTSVIKKPWPLPEITGNTFSAVWEGYVQPRFTEPGRLLVYLDMGVQRQDLQPHRMRLWVNGKLELDYWDKRAWNEVHLPTRLLDMNAGKRTPIKLEYSCTKPADELALCWESPSVEVQHIPTTCLYPKKD